jgi:hypothetical protein
MVGIDGKEVPGVRVAQVPAIQIPEGTVEAATSGRIRILRPKDNDNNNSYTAEPI